MGKPAPLVNTHKELVEVWWSHNNTISPHEVSRGSRKSALWRCPVDNSHEFPAVVAHMTRRPGCRLCSKQLVVSGVNDAVTTHGDVIGKLYDYEANTIDPATVASGTAKKAWWRCPECSYKWYTSFLSVTRGSGCARCSGVVPNPGVNTVDYLFPDLVRDYWDWESNTKDPSEITRSSSHHVDLRCPECKYMWTTSAYNFFTLGSRCSLCINRVTVPGVNDVVTTDSDIILNQWSSKNTIDPRYYVRGSNKKAYWECGNGHVRYVSIAAVVVDGDRCLLCTHKESKVQRDVRDYVKSIYPGEVSDTPVRDVIPPREVDIYIPGIRLAIEVNGVFHHSTYYSAHADSRRDRDKSLQLLETGVSFVSVWSDDWYTDPGEVKERISSTIEILQQVSGVSEDQAVRLFGGGREGTSIHIPLDNHLGSRIPTRWTVARTPEPDYSYLNGSFRVQRSHKKLDLPKVYEYGYAEMRAIDD